MHLSTGHRALHAFVEADALEEEVTHGESLLRWDMWVVITGSSRWAMKCKPCDQVSGGLPINRAPPLRPGRSRHLRHVG
jgi:hypothetical protein